MKKFFFSSLSLERGETQPYYENYEIPLNDENRIIPPYARDQRYRECKML